MRRSVPGFIAALAALTTTAAHAQVIDDPEAVVVDELVVNARLPGPAWWKITDGDTTIYLLGTLHSLPENQPWDRSVLERRMTGAFALILPPEGKAGIGDIPGLLALRGRLKSDRPLDAAVPDLAPKLDKVRAQLGKKPDAYREWSPLGAGIMIANDYRQRARLDPAEPERTVGRLARKHRVKARPVASYKLMPLAKAAVRGHSSAAGRVCLEGVLDEAAGGAAPAQVAAQAWARGDVRGAIGGPRNFQRCMLSLPGMADLERRGTQAEIDALAAAMNTPGHAVALFPIRGLVAKGGVLDQLRARGFSVSTPGE
jgi:uncharacterized protein YbaP (TraB family)